MTTPSWLPDKKYYEYVHHKFFTPGVEWSTWSPWPEWTYPEADILRFSHIVENQLPYLCNRRVLDAGCWLGSISLISLHNNATFVTGIDVKDKPLELAREVTKLAGYTNCEFKNVDISHHTEFRALCDNHDTVILAGVLPLLIDHYAVLRNIAESNAQTVIINSTSSFISGNRTPIVDWILYPTTTVDGAYHTSQTELFVGQPNQKWIERALLDLKFKIVYNRIFEFNENDGTLNSHCVLVGTKS
jgi:2-polyprenyl-3-methyl-5-hydroxy-6-metoxy-1,4-benzoquinol methylase